MAREDRFILPEDAIEVVQRSGGLSVAAESLLEVGRQRVAAGESIDEVALDIALWDAALTSTEKE